MSAIISVVLVVILSSLVLVTSNRIAEKNKQLELADEVHRAVSELGIVNYEYLLHHEERMEEQWNLRYGSMAEILEKEEEEEAMRSICADYISLGDLFSQVTANYKERQNLIHEGASQEKIDANILLEERLESQLLIKSQSLITDTSKLAKKVSAEVLFIQKRFNTLTLTLMIIIAVIITAISLVVARSISKPIDKLIKGAKIVGKGNLKHKIESETKDEVGELAVAFNKMTTNLKEVTASRDDLNKEVAKRKQMDGERERLLKELEAKNTELDRFTYTVSHDLRSPLITVQGFVEMLREDLERNEKEKMKGDLKYIENGTAKMEHLLNDTLRLSRIGRMVNPPEDVSFGEIVQEALEQTTGQIKSSGVEVSVVEDFPTVHVDRMRIAEVLVNLIINSINYMGEQPSPKIDIGYRVDGEETVFFVQDNRIGIDKSQHEKVFELFYTVDKSGKGTGAGLAIVKRIIEVHEGRIWIESEKGKGCSVCFTLPIQSS